MLAWQALLCVKSAKGANAEAPPERPGGWVGTWIRILGPQICHVHIVTDSFYAACLLKLGHAPSRQM